MIGFDYLGKAGQLGNQMFQFAATKGIAQNRGYDMCVPQHNEKVNDGIIAQWHDESQMNKFFAERRDDVHVLGPQYAYPEVFKQACNFEPKIVHLAKNNSEYHI